MATQTQYEIFKSIYDEEFTRYKELINRAKIFLGICTFFLGSLAFKLDKVAVKLGLLVCYNYILAVICFIFAFLLLIISLSVYTYEGMFSPQKEIESFGEDPPIDANFLDKRLSDIAVATERNSFTNDRRAMFIKVASFLIFIGVVMSFISFFNLTK